MLGSFKNLFKRILGIKYYTKGLNSQIAYPNKIMNPSKDKTKIIIGENSVLRCEIQILGHGGRVNIGDYCFIGENSYIWSGKSIKIGDRVLIGHNCNIFDNDIHPFDKDERHSQFKDILSTGHPKIINLNDDEVVIEEDVWIGANVTIMKGIRVCKGSIVGAGSVVTKNIEPFTVNAGNPSKILRRLDEK
jgi:acetyltransferase-like isoleucine patch superfamily enzyme